MGVASINLTQLALKSKSLKSDAFGVITPFKVIQGHRLWYQSKARIQLPISE